MKFNSLFLRVYLYISISFIEHDGGLWKLQIFGIAKFQFSVFITVFIFKIVQVLLNLCLDVIHI